jgi:hypothetical protein
VPGFSLAARCWGVAMVHGVSAIQYNDRIFDAVVLPPARKKLIQALVTNHSYNSSTGEHQSADLIEGKGEGSIFLLYGPPGGTLVGNCQQNNRCYGCMNDGAKHALLTELLFN